jgi:hypothetical protein
MRSTDVESTNSSARLHEREVVENKHSTDVESHPPYTPRVGMSIHPHLRPCSDLG